MNTLALAIHSFPAANEVVRRHWGNFLLAGADLIVLIGTTDGGCETPSGALQEMISADLYCVGAHLPLRFLRTLQHLREKKCDWFCVAEYDVLFLKPIPRHLPEGLTAHLAGGKPAGCHCNAFYHGPWIMDRDTADVMVQAGYELLAEKKVDPSPDCFIGQIVERANIPVHTDLLKSYSRNTVEGEVWTREARTAVEAGAVCVHGVKSLETFETLTR